MERKVVAGQGFQVFLGPPDVGRCGVAVGYVRPEGATEEAEWGWPGRKLALVDDLPERDLERLGGPAVLERRGIVATEQLADERGPTVGLRPAGLVVRQSERLGDVRLLDLERVGPSGDHTDECFRAVSAELA